MQNFRFRIFFTPLFICLLLTSCDTHEESQEPEEVLRLVRFQQVFSTSVAKVRTFSGTAQAGVESKLSFKVSGTIQRLDVKVGARVKKGHLIAALDPEDYILKVQHAEASLARALAEARNEEANYKRVRELYENDNASLNDLDAARAAAESTAAAVRSYQTQIELAKLQLQYTKLKAASDGAIAEVNVELNENVAAGFPIVMLTAGADLEVEVAIPESLISDINEGSPATVRFDALPGRDFKATITEVGVATTKFATTYPVTVRLARRDPDVRFGMAAEVAITFEPKGRSGVFILPPLAVGEDREGRFVFVIEPAEQGLGVARRRPVKIGELTADGLEVTEGLADGDRVAVVGVSKLTEGLKVKFSEAEGNK